MITNDELIEDLQLVSKINHDRYITVNHYRKHGKYDNKTVVARFGSWSNALKAANLIHYPDDILGKRFGKLVVINRTDDKKDRYYLWRCKCDCGNTTFINQSLLKRGLMTSCGCGRGEVMRDRERLRNEILSKYEIDEETGLRYPDFDKKLLKSNTSGYTGVYRKKDKWVCELIVKGEKYRQYGFDTAEEAYKGRLRLEEEHLPAHFKKRLDERRNEK